MDEEAELDLKKICCTCLSIDRKLIQLCKLNDGVNNLYYLLSYDPEAYKEGFFKESASLHVCWECRALIRRIIFFRWQVCVAQRHLSSPKIKHLKPLSRLAYHYKNTYDYATILQSEVVDNFIDCSNVEVKVEVDGSDDVPLSELQDFSARDKNEKRYIANEDYSQLHTDAEETPLSELNDNFANVQTKVSLKPNKVHKKTKTNKKNCKKKTKIKGGLNDEELYKTIALNEKEIFESREKRKMDSSFVESPYRCESCIEVFNSLAEFEDHNLCNHIEKPDHSLCDICLSYTPTTSHKEHLEKHYLQYVCQVCEHTAYCLEDIASHLKSEHGLKILGVHFKRKKAVQQMAPVRRNGSKPRRNTPLVDTRTPYGYQCPECSKHFENKNQRWKHIQRMHRDGFRCHTCGKRFAFRNSLSRHELLHSEPPPREECPICHKMIRVDLVKVHARIHSARESFSCAACDKAFVSRASYHHHLKYTMSHSNADILKYKCGVCDKGYRSRGELRDHENYQHRGHTRHQCPICGKALATRRCITRHVRRAHDGIKESARDKICQQCGKAFRDKKGLREHEFIHTGERPLSCEVCGCSFRQSASLYTHRKRVHKIHAPRKQVQLLEDSGKL